MTRSRVIVLNTVATYARSVIAMGLTLFSSRWVLHALGESDFGLFSVVGSVIVFITFLNTTLAGSTARFFSYAIGQGKPAEVNQWFNAALSAHLVLAICLVSLGLPTGDYILSHFISIPNGRMNIAHWVFRISLCSAFFGMVSVPFVGMFTAHQRIAELSILTILQPVGTFILAYAVTRVHADRLFFYAIGLTNIIILVQVLTIIRAYSVFKECKLKLSDWFHCERIGKIGSFAVWNLIGGLGGTLRDQGLAVLLNIYFGTKVNAAYGISSQVSSATNQLSAAMMGAFAPEITRSEGEGDRKRMLILAQRANKFGTILMLAFAVPLFIEMDFVLKVWLTVVPEHTSILCRLTMIMFLFDRLTSGYMLAVAAFGRIAVYQITVGGILLLTLPIALLFLRLGFPPPFVGLASVLTLLFCSVSRALWVKNMFNVGIVAWIKQTVFPCALVGFISSLVGLTICYFLPTSLLRFMLVSCCTLFFMAGMVWAFATDQEEHELLLNVVCRFVPCGSVNSALRIRILGGKAN